MKKIFPSKGGDALHDRLNEVLLDGERVVWYGRPAPFKLMKAPFRAPMIATWAVTALVVLVVLYSLAQACLQGFISLSDVLVISFVSLFVPVLLALRPFMDKRCLEQNTVYAITNCRVIALIQTQVMYLTLPVDAAVQTVEKGFGNVCVGQAVGQDIKESRSLAILGLRNRRAQGNLTGLLFYHIPNPQQLLRYFSDGRS